MSPSSEPISVRSNIDSSGDEAAQSNAQSIPPIRFATVGIDCYSFILQRYIGLLALRPRLAWLTKPKNLLLLDSVGAVVTSLSTGLLLTTIVPTGLPAWILWTLSIIAAGFACVDLVAYCYRTDVCQVLAIIGLMNLLYCIAAMATCFIYLSVITTMGMIYFAIEGAIVIPLATLEFAVATHCWHGMRTNNPIDRSGGSTAC